MELPGLIIQRDRDLSDSAKISDLIYHLPQEFGYPENEYGT